jgi:hypothetical protein
MADPDLSRNFRASSWSWFMQCRNCSGPFNYPPGFFEKKAKRGALGPRRLCAACVMTIIMNWRDDG